MSNILSRLCAGVCLTALVSGTAAAQTTMATASTVDCSDSQSSPTASVAVCVPAPANGLTIATGITASYSSSSAGADIFGAQITLRSDDFAGGGGFTNDFLTFTGATPPSQVFVYFVATVDATAQSDNENTFAHSEGDVSVAYNGGVSTLRRRASDEYGSIPVFEDDHDANLSMIAGMWRGTFGYAGPGASFGTSVSTFVEMLSHGGPDPLAGGGSGRALFRLAGFGVADASGKAIADASCSFRSQTPCTIVNVIDVTTTPEPSALLLLATGLLGVMGAARLRRPLPQR